MQAAADRASIQTLPPLLVDQIAAGEVVERPSSVVKELLENAVDAGATRIVIDAEEGGGALVRVSDDGGGIPADQLGLALSPHATSKLRDADGLAAIATLGFRGEALASIASVARVRVVSRPPGEELAAAIEQAGGPPGPVAPLAAPAGTTVEVRDLFFNVPARRRFLRAAPTEYGRIAATVQQSAMTHPRVGFRLTHNGRVTLELPAGQDPWERGVAILGRDLDDALLRLDRDEPGWKGASPMRVLALLGRPEIGRASSKFQHFSVNGRPVRDRQLVHALKEAYRGLMPADRQPVAAVHLTLDPAAVDVNVHPTKAEVRFRDAGAAHSLIRAACRERLLAEDLTPALHPRTAGGSGPNRPRSAAQGFELREPSPSRASFDYAATRDELDRLADAPAGQRGAAGAGGPAVAGPPRKVVQFSDSFLVTEDAEGLLVIDQHALHERVMFEKLWKRILGEGKPLEKQRLLVPVTVTADAGRQALLDDLAPLLESLALELEPMGPRTLAVQAFPTLLKSRGVAVGPFVEGLLDAAENGDLAGPADAGGRVTEAALAAVLDMMSCKAAVKAGDRLSGPELDELLRLRDEVERSSSCPHGRPTTLRLTWNELRHRFGR
ncbi:DNA mismatch repair endonuclease MutL [Phycisphaera mikurensis]|uniref:DNA mismatch repair protein MutL n=1 Tax=Phycisphaera mikurensis (strain NBRC 102666 / KCTC 22515 / FYK2301M01) TaxID=1142394 RepID=I0IG19_PHYMF|nr:DNA mismatch repair endonuclease MutL [Phycisphaera mikurensis]MBB6440408.1 DNA mismatch repair protein MutL [Phycisphaera mikurensis]BAM04207.1 DNA mismatch repair protein MutL [Phycisphaera mikurensis NBRC 102666]